MPETGDSYTFEDVASFSARELHPTESWPNILGVGLGRWRITPSLLLTPPMTRKKVVGALKALDAASNMILTALLNGQLMHFVSAQSPGFDRLAMSNDQATE